jgi:beta-glucosidase
VPRRSLALLALLVTVPAPAPARADRVDDLIAKMTLEEKFATIGGTDFFYVRALPRLGLPALRMADGPIGVRNYGPSTAYAAGIALAASWDSELARAVGASIGRDARARGVHILLGPDVNLYRAPMGGRNGELLGEDPFLAARIAVGYVLGVQAQGVCATVKHLVGNDTEIDRHDGDVRIDERALRELYLVPFEAAVTEAHACALMDSYNLLDGTHATENRALNLDIVRRDWGFGGIIMSDWFATYDGVAAANAGLDLEMPFAEHMNAATLQPALRAGTVTVATLDEKVRHILRAAVGFGWLDREQTDLDWPRYGGEGRRVALRSAEESMVLLKNDRGLLPLATRNIAVIGPGAYPAVPVVGGSAMVKPFRAVSFLEGLTDAVGKVGFHPGIPTLAELADATVLTSDGKRGVTVEVFADTSLEGTPERTYTAGAVNIGPGRAPDAAWGDLAARPKCSSRWTGTYTAAAAGRYAVFVQSSGEDSGFRLAIDGTTVLDGWRLAPAFTAHAEVTLAAGPHRVVLEHWKRHTYPPFRLRLGIAAADGLVAPEATELARRADAVVVAVGYDADTEREGADRSFRLPPGQDRLIQQIAAANPHTIVVVTGGGNVDMEPWIDRVPALIEAWYPGEEGGTALAELLLGTVNPSGHLPASFERRWEDNPAYDGYEPDPKTGRVVYREGLSLGYRGYRVAPRFPFGFGLSYSTFRYTNLAVRALEPVAARARVEVEFDVTNTSTRAGAAVPQLYVAEVHPRVLRPPQELKGFAKVRLKPGETQRVTIRLEPRAFATWDVAAHAWRASPGRYQLVVGSSATQTELRGEVTLR